MHRRRGSSLDAMERRGGAEPALPGGSGGVGAGEAAWEGAESDSEIREETGGVKLHLIQEQLLHGAEYDAGAAAGGRARTLTGTGEGQLPDGRSPDRYLFGSPP